MKIIPDEVFDDAAPLSGNEVVQTTTPTERKLLHKKNMFVTLLDGRFFVGYCQVNPDGTATIGTSDRFETSLVETAREV